MERFFFLKFLKENLENASKLQKKLFEKLFGKIIKVTFGCENKYELKFTNKKKLKQYFSKIKNNVFLSGWTCEWHWEGIFDGYVATISGKIGRILFSNSLYYFWKEKHSWVLEEFLKASMEKFRNDFIKAQLRKFTEGFQKKILGKSFQAISRSNNEEIPLETFKMRIPKDFLKSHPYIRIFQESIDNFSLNYLGKFLKKSLESFLKAALEEFLKKPI